jgi:prepilin-type processing-associated H-X9-DG protein
VQQASDDGSRGKLWDASVSNSSSMILLIESFSALHCPESVPNYIGYAPPAVVGFVPVGPAERFYSGGSWAAYVAEEGRFGETASHICYSRHRRAKEPGGLGNASGRLNIAFADGHVAIHSDEDLWDHNTNKLTGVAMWSPIDREIEANSDVQPPQ